MSSFGGRHLDDTLRKQIWRCRPSFFTATFRISSVWRWTWLVRKICRLLFLQYSKAFIFQATSVWRLCMRVLIHNIVLCSCFVVPWIVVSLSCECSLMAWIQWCLFHGFMLLIISLRTDCRTSPEWFVLSPRWSHTSYRIIIPEMEANWWVSKDKYFASSFSIFGMHDIDFKKLFSAKFNFICTGPLFTISKVLDVYAAFACVEYLEPRNLDTNDQRQTWLRLVKKLQVPIELICSEDIVRHYGERSKAIVRRVQ